MNHKLLERAQEVLAYNDVGEWTRPAPALYPHQWLWDSSFIAMGLAHYDVKRAQQEIVSLFRGQWTNGMVPHMVFGPTKGYHAPADMWSSKLSPQAPEDVATSAITQPPMIAEAVVRIGKQLKKAERRKWYRLIWPHLLAHHEWLYRDRNPHAEGLAVLLHPWETGMDNTPPWMVAMHRHQKPFWIKLIELTHTDKLVEQLRRDTRQVPPDERMTTVESLLLYNVVRRLRRKQYDVDRILLRSHFIIEDIFFNSILIRNNHHLKTIAQEINEEIPAQTLSYMNKAQKALEQLWDEETGMYYNRMFVTRKLIKIPTIATLLPLYAGTVSKSRAEQLAMMLDDPKLFHSQFPIPSVPLNSEYFDHRRYWQGPTWINTNWLIIDGLKRYGFKDEAERIRKRTIDMVERSDFFEYFSPTDGYGAGVAPFSWSAALIIDMLKQET